MAKRLTETEKWKDTFFRSLSPDAKLLYLYQLDSCDVAGFWEIDMQLAEFMTGIEQDRLERAMKELKDRYLLNGKYVWIKNYLKHQKNDNLNLNNNAHIGIMRRIAEHKPLIDQILTVLDKKELLEIIQKKQL